MLYLPWTFELVYANKYFDFAIFTDLIDDITDHTDRTGHRLIKETRHIRIVDRKSATCCKYIHNSSLFMVKV